MSAPPVAIVGGGFLGSALARALPTPSIVVTRSGAWPDGPAPEAVTVVGLDITDADLDPRPLLDADALVIAVAPGRTQDRRAVYVEGPARLLEAVGHHPWRRVVFVSSISAFASVDGWVDEDTTAAPDTERGIVQREAEDVVARWATARGIPWLCLRLGGLYGPGREIGRIYRRRRDGPVPGDGHAPTNLIHRDDAVAACRAALDARPETVGIVSVVDDDHRTRRVMYDAVARVAGQEPLQWEHDVRPGTPPRGKRVSNLRLKLELGVRLQHPTHPIG